MRTVNLAGSTLTWSFGSIIAIIVLILAIVAAFGGIPMTPIFVMGMIAALAVARLC